MVRGASFGNEEVHISYLQFADDTVLFLEPKLDYLINTKRILRCFEMASSLKVNFYKSCVIRVGKKVSDEEDWAASFKCKKENLPITYLGLPLGSRPSSRAIWNSVMLRIEKKLAPWKKKFLSKGGRVVLIKYVLASIPTYFLSVFKVLVSIAKDIERCQRGFFWSDGAVKRKILAVDWETVCKSKRKGGLGIGRILDKNKRSLAKWVWRFGKERGSLWKKVICAKYGIHSSSLLWKWNVPSLASPFAKAVSSLFMDGSLSAKILEDGLKVVVGSSARVCFWNDVWWGEVPFKETFPRIFALSTQKRGLINEYGSWQGEEWMWNVKLRRRVFYWEMDQWNEFMVTLASFKVRRAAWWFKHHHGRGSSESITLILENLNTCCIDVKQSKPLKAANWSPPVNEAFKFNMDGAVRAEMGRAGI
ncbi:hypothetical protein Dsin_007809 [Dipteronia sinensis]|uniref:Uncharacterized protein n=1 Tax=Dipteronia sinensis TaxID=43782 RepID=A0AAE0EHF5_9ROSI|nr:hypothetical protein Dsin_007809 [Dipteronia sinensis]